MELCREKLWLTSFFDLMCSNEELHKGDFMWCDVLQRRNASGWYICNSFDFFLIPISVKFFVMAWFLRRTLIVCACLFVACFNVMSNTAATSLMTWEIITDFLSVISGVGKYACVSKILWCFSPSLLQWGWRPGFRRRIHKTRLLVWQCFRPFRLAVTMELCLLAWHLPIPCPNCGIRIIRVSLSFSCC